MCGVTRMVSTRWPARNASSLRSLASDLRADLRLGGRRPRRSGRPAAEGGGPPPAERAPRRSACARTLTGCTRHPSFAAPSSCARSRSSSGCCCSPSGSCSCSSPSSASRPGTCSTRASPSTRRCRSGRRTSSIALGVLVLAWALGARDRPGHGRERRPDRPLRRRPPGDRRGRLALRGAARRPRSC